MTEEKSTSIAQITANRQNALKSTGPKTMRGKHQASRNSFKHGLLSQAVVIDAGDGTESRLEYDALLDQLHDDLKPQGVLEAMLVERIAVCYWRLRRAIRAEIGLTRLELDDARLRYLRELELEANPDHICNSFALDRMLECLDSGRKDIEETGTIRESVLTRLKRWFKNERQFVSQCLSLAETVLSRQKKEVREAAQASLVELFSQERDSLTSLRASQIEREEREMEVTIASLALPPVEMTDKIHRYEATIERQLYRTIRELERLQQQRRGELDIWLCLSLLRGETPIGETKPKPEDENP